jgi:hypothetical protein
MNPWNVYLVGFHGIIHEIIILTCQTMYVSIVGIATERNINYISKTWGKTLVSCVAFNTSMCTIAFISLTQSNVACITNICTIKSIETSGAFWKTEDSLYNEFNLDNKTDKIRVNLRKRKWILFSCITPML